MSGERQPRTMKTVEASWDVILKLKELDGAGVTELARELDLPKGTVYTHLATLRKRKLVVKDDQTYRLGLHFLNLGEYVRNRRRLYAAGRAEVDRLAEETDEYVHLVTEEHGELIYLHEARGKNAVGKEYFSKKFERPNYLHSSAYGKAILAYLPEERVEWIIEEHGLPAMTESTISSRAELAAELEGIRERGFALNDEEEIRGVRAVGAPILDEGGDVLGAISLTKPAGRLQGEQFRHSIPKVVTTSANVIEVNIQGMDNQDRAEI